MWQDERGGIVTEAELMQEYKRLRATEPETYDYSFRDYIRNCLAENGGTLEEVRL